MKREMVEVILYEDGKYTVEDISPDAGTQRLFGRRGDMNVDIYHCPKKNWKKYLLKLAATTKIDKQIAELKKRRQKMLALIIDIKEQLSSSEVEE